MNIVLDTMSISFDTMTIAFQIPAFLGVMFCALYSGFTTGTNARRKAVFWASIDDPTKQDIAEAIEYVKERKSDADWARAMGGCGCDHCIHK